MVAADTNVLVRVFVGDDAGQVAVAEEFMEKGAWVSTLALAETMWVLGSTYRKGAPEIAEAVESLLNHRDVTVENPEAVEAALALFRKRPGLRFADCLILELARKAGHLPLGTFDREFGKVAGAERL